LRICENDIADVLSILEVLHAGIIKEARLYQGIASIIINTMLFGLKIWVGTASSSVAMTADAWHTLSDTLTSIVVIFGFWISSRPEDEKHPLAMEELNSLLL